MKSLWFQSLCSVQEEEALKSIFGDNYIIATTLYNWLKEILPFRCGVRMGKDRITFLIGNYRPAALKYRRKGVRLDMVFTDRLPKGFKETGYVWESVPNTIEGYAIVQNVPLLLTKEDITNFVKTCNKALKVAPKSRKHECNILATWPSGK